MARFGSEPQEFFKAVYAERAPWDIGTPQPALMNLVREFPPASPILDVGCGSGDLAIALAQEGHEVVGVDFVPAAVEQARAKARAPSTPSPLRLEFIVADALHLSQLGRRFGAVVDSGFYHLFDEAESDLFVDELALTLRPGGRYYLLAFATEFPIPHGPRAVTEREVRARFTPARGWQLRTCHPTEFLSLMASVPATCACVERLGR